MAEPPSAIYRSCPTCGEEVLQQVVRGRIGSGAVVTFDGTLRCTGCGSTYHSTFKLAGTVDASIIVSWMGESKRTKIGLDADEVVEVGEEMYVDGRPVLVTSIEAEGRRVQRAEARSIDTIWSKRFEKVKVKFSINKGGKTISKHIMASPEEEFYVGDLIDMGRFKVVIHRIKTKASTIQRGGAPASEIVRVYSREVR